MSGEAILVLLVLIGILGKSNVIATAACVLLIVKLTNLNLLMTILEKRGLELGLLFLTISVLVPFATEKVTPKEIGYTITSLAGLLSIAGGAIATTMNKDGLEMLKIYPELMIGLVIGSIIGIVAWKGIPVGPLMAAGIAALFIKIVKFFKFL